MVREPGQSHSSNGHRPASGKKKSRQAAPSAEYSVLSSEIGFVPRGQPLPLTDAIRQLPRRYRFILTKPGFEPFLAERGLADWKIVWLQLLIWTAWSTLLGLLRFWLYPAPSSSSGSALSSVAVLRASGLASSLGLIVLIPMLFFFAMGLLYLLARAWHGHGLFVQQAYTALLFLTPGGIVVSVLGIIPFAGSFLAAFFGILFFVYSVVLECFAMLAVHQLPGGRATAAAVITALILIPVMLICFALLTFFFVAI